MPTEIPLDHSVLDIFGVGTFLSAGEWEAVKRRVSNGEAGLFGTKTDGRGSSTLFVETSATPDHSPMLVKVLTYDRGIRANGGVNEQNATWLVDYCADGSVDRVIDYISLERADKQGWMVIYYSRLAYGQPGVIVSSRRLRVTDYEYIQSLNQWKSNFTGNMSLYMFYYDRHRRSLEPIYEAPFCFYDMRGNGRSQIAVRFEVEPQFTFLRAKMGAARYLLSVMGFKDKVSSVRYSFDLKDDVLADRKYSYDFSITAIGGITPKEGARTRLRLRNMWSEPVLSCESAREVAEAGGWKSAALTWVEDGVNYAEEDSERRERWEGVINRGSRYFPQVGGPPSPETNRRTEIASHHEPPMRLYYSDVDHRLHLWGARLGWLKIDYDFDGKVDMGIRYLDTDGDGIFDRWEIDLDGDGTTDRVVVPKNKRTIHLDLEYGPLATFYLGKLRESISEDEELMGTLKRIIPPSSERPIEKVYQGLASPGRDNLGKLAGRGMQFRRLVLDVMLRLYAEDLRLWLERTGYDPRAISRIFDLFDSGNHGAMNLLLQQLISKEWHSTAGRLP